MFDSDSGATAFECWNLPTRQQIPQANLIQDPWRTLPSPNALYMSLFLSSNTSPPQNLGLKAVTSAFSHSCTCKKSRKPLKLLCCLFDAKRLGDVYLQKNSVRLSFSNNHGTAGFSWFAISRWLPVPLCYAPFALRQEDDKSAHQTDWLHSELVKRLFQQPYTSGLRATQDTARSSDKEESNGLIGPQGFCCNLLSLCIQQNSITDIG